jgi:hypothetical protein
MKVIGKDMAREETGRQVGLVMKELRKHNKGIWTLT